MNDEMDINWCLFGDGDYDEIYEKRYPGQVILTGPFETVVTCVHVPTFDSQKEMEDWVSELLNDAPDGLRSFLYDQLHKRGERIDQCRDRIAAYRKGLKS